MSIHFNWGPPGSYKTSYSLYLIIKKVLFSQNPRFFITNVSGLNFLKIFKIFSKDFGGTISETDWNERFENYYFNINSDVSSLKDRTLLARFFPIWAPFGAFVFFDEIQLIYPKKFSPKQFELNFEEYEIPSFVYEFRDKFLEVSKNLISENISIIKLNFILEYGISEDSPIFSRKYSEYLDSEVFRLPSSLSEAFCKHRHWGWDFEFTCQNLSQVSRDVLDVSEGAHYQKNLALSFGIFGKGKFKRYFHTTNRFSPEPGDSGTPTFIDKRVFQCYSSTAVGQFSDTLAGKTTIFSGFKFLKLYFAIVFLLIVFFLVGSYFFGAKNDSKNSKTNLPASSPFVVDRPENSSLSVRPSSQAVHSVPSNNDSSPSSPNFLEPKGGFLDEDVFIYISGYSLLKEKGKTPVIHFAGELRFSDGSVSHFSQFPFQYTLVPHSACFYSLYYQSASSSRPRLIRYIHCPPSPSSTSTSISASNIFPSVPTAVSTNSTSSTMTYK